MKFIRIGAGILWASILALGWYCDFPVGGKLILTGFIVGLVTLLYGLTRDVV